MMALRWSTPPALSGSPAAQFVYAVRAVPAGGSCQSQVWLAAAVPASPPVSTSPSQQLARLPQAVRASSFSAALWMDAIAAPICVQRASASA